MVTVRQKGLDILAVLAVILLVCLGIVCLRYSTEGAESQIGQKTCEHISARGEALAKQHQKSTHSDQTGEKSKFHEHSSEPNDSFMLNPVYEAVVAHERGHATAFFEQWRILFSAALTRYNIDDPSLSISAVEQLVSMAYTETWNVHIADRGYLANERTNGWFEGNPTWERMPNETARNGDILYEWKKKE